LTFARSDEDRPWQPGIQALKDLAANGKGAEAPLRVPGWLRGR
jgi:hypothetical protein